MGQKESEPVPYWLLREVAERGQAQPFIGSEMEAIMALEAYLLKSIGLQMIADVPLGAFLSGGIDSSTVVALMQAQSSRPVKTFTIGFHEKDYNEAQHANSVARHLGTEHTELYVTPDEAINVIPRLPALYDEPFSDSSQIPTFLASQLAKQHVTVSLSGDAGDELFGGYNRYNYAMQLKRKFDWLPYPVRPFLSKILAMPPAPVWACLGRLTGVSRGAEKASRVIEILAAPDNETVYRTLVSHWKSPKTWLLAEPSRRRSSRTARLGQSLRSLSSA